MNPGRNSDEPELDAGRPGSSHLSTISEVASQFGVTLRALRFYEDRGLISPLRQGMTRLYSVEDCRRLKTILEGKKLGFTLTEISSMLSAGTSPSAQPTLSLSLEQARRQRDELIARRRELDAAIADLTRTCEALEKAAVTE